MTSTDGNLARLRAFTQAFNDHDIGALLIQVTEDAVLRRGDGSAEQGPDALRDLLQGLIVAFPDARLNLLETIAFGPEAAVIEWRFVGTQLGPLALPWEDMRAEASGRAVSAPWSALVFFDQAGLIARLELRAHTAPLVSEAATEAEVPDAAAIRAMTQAYTLGWNSGDPTAVGAHYAESGWIRINDGPPWEGREGVTAMAASFMEAFPGMRLSLDDLRVSGSRAVFSWTLEGANDGPGGTGKRVRISGHEIWRIDGDCKVASSHGYFDSSAFGRQLTHGSGED